MAITDAERLRALLNDTDPDEPVLTDEQIDELLEEHDDVERAALGGWRLKAAHYADLIDITEGNASRKMSQLHTPALNMVKMYASSRAGSTEGRTRIGRVVRRI